MSYGVAADPAGNILVTGSMAGTIDFGGGPLTSAGSSDVFLAKYSAGGAVLWTKHLGGPGPDVGYGVASDSAGNVIVVGYFTARWTLAAARSQTPAPMTFSSRNIPPPGHTFGRNDSAASALTWPTASQWIRRETSWSAVCSGQPSTSAAGR